MLTLDKILCDCVAISSSSKAKSLKSVRGLTKPAIHTSLVVGFAEDRELRAVRGVRVPADEPTSSSILIAGEAKSLRSRPATTEAVKELLLPKWPRRNRGARNSV